eukprot:9139457-Pyramimonas_sp.AAC.1
MIGEDPSGDLSTKAAETFPLVKWAVHLCTEFPRARDATHLKRGGENVLEYMRIIKEAGPTIDMGTCQTLLDMTLMHCSALKRAEI